MKQKLFIFLFLILIVVTLVGLNAASYVQKEKTPDSELRPNRSTYNVGTTGTQALYSLLSETGRKVVRWQEPPDALINDKKNKSAVFVVIGMLRREFTGDEADSLLRWVSSGGRLILIDREPPAKLITTTANWRIWVNSSDPFKFLGVDASDQNQMTADTQAIKPVQPTVFTQSINAVQPSRFAATIEFERFEEVETDLAGLTSPVVHFASASKNLLVETPYGDGKIVFLSDPFIVSNGGIGLVDNAQLAINILAAGSSTIAFDEYHQGYGSNNNKFLEFFEGTPVVAIFLQCLLLAGFVFFSQSRRFARAVPESDPDRLSKLEYVSAMAELQERTHSFDLAIENIYNDFRRRATRLLGADNYTVRYDELAKFIAERTGIDAVGVAETLFKCEEIIRGEPTNKREVLELSGELRVLEEKLGLTRNRKGKI